MLERRDSTSFRYAAGGLVATALAAIIGLATVRQL